MGVELHIARADFWADNDAASISPEEWLADVATDPELALTPEVGRHFEGHVVWTGPSKYEEPWLRWFQGKRSGCRRPHATATKPPMTPPL